MYLTCHPLVDDSSTRKHCNYDDRDQSSGGETTWTSIETTPLIQCQVNNICGVRLFVLRMIVFFTDQFLLRLIVKLSRQISLISPAAKEYDCAFCNKSTNIGKRIALYI